MTNKNKEITVNDGGGLYDNAGLCDTIANGVNELLKSAFSGNYILFCEGVTSITQRLVNLKKGIIADLESKDKTIEELKEENARLVEQITGLPVERTRDGGKNGND